MKSERILVYTDGPPLSTRTAGPAIKLANRVIGTLFGFSGIVLVQAEQTSPGGKPLAVVRNA